MRIYIIGMPGSGKTTFAKKIANSFNLDFLDLDNEIVLTENSSISEIFSRHGEDYFRRIEQEQLLKTENLTNVIVSTGGGTPCFFENMIWMNKAGATIFINTPLETLQKHLKNDSSRPLLTSESLETLWHKREKYYSQAHFTVDNYDQLLTKIKRITA